jgi:hypothetical protein
MPNLNALNIAALRNVDPAAGSVRVEGFANPGHLHRLGVHDRGISRHVERLRLNLVDGRPHACWIGPARIPTE